ncbi:hypothetical protein NLU13_4445 [Sarocladium strictum]|uniref:Cytochrome P450 n=1 Tax=Sarocladium strictum TaxID=5046 RepID=A0AA39GIX0_SARSR|nr:hypothetical protein NLU13_4445 [Sarocladium strictum]
MAIIEKVSGLAFQPFLIETVGLILLIVLARFLWGPLDKREPPALRSRIPIVGHLIGLIRNGPHHLPILGEKGRPISTLPIVQGRLYAVWDPAIVQSLQKSKNLSFFPFLRLFIKKETAYDPRHEDIMQRDPGVLEEGRKVIQTSMTLKHIRAMNLTALDHLAKELEKITADEPLRIDNMWIWFRNTMTSATCEALFGRDNPTDKTDKYPTIMDDVWTFEGGVDRLVMAPWPSLTCRKIITSRNRLQAAMREYYSNRSDEKAGVSELIRGRAAMLRDFGLNDDDIGGYEIMIIHVAITNTIGTGFWFFAYIYTTPGLVEALRDEAEAAVQRSDEDKVTVDIAHIVEKCPLLVACYRESLRLTNQFIGNRQLQADTTVSDSSNRTYLLKKGICIQWPARFLHTSKEVWGDDAMEFKPERFLEMNKDPDSPETKRKLASYIPFGGGKHYCPGRSFAQAENVGVVLTMILGYEVSPLQGDWSSVGIPEKDTPSFASAIYKPARNGRGWGVNIQRRKGWENATWKYVT